MGITASCMRSSDERTASAYHSALMSALKIVWRVGVYKPEHQDFAKMFVWLSVSALAGMLYILSVVGGGVPLVQSF